MAACPHGQRAAVRLAAAHRHARRRASRTRVCHGGLPCRGCCAAAAVCPFAAGPCGWWPRIHTGVIRPSGRWPVTRLRVGATLVFTCSKPPCITCTAESPPAGVPRAGAGVECGRSCSRHSARILRATCAHGPSIVADPNAEVDRGGRMEHARAADSLGAGSASLKSLRRRQRPP